MYAFLEFKIKVRLRWSAWRSALAWLPVVCEKLKIKKVKGSLFDVWLEMVII